MDYANQVIPRAPDESPSKIRDAVGSFEQLAGDLHKVLSRLESRLDTVLTPVPPPGQTATPESLTPIASSLLARLYGANDTLSVAIQRVADLQQRVEV